jgi:hypothetical protein
MNLSCGRCKAIRAFSGQPLKCDVCGWELIKSTPDSASDAFAQDVLGSRPRGTKVSAKQIGKDIGSALGSFVLLIKWCAIVVVIFIAAAWIFEPTFRYSVKSVEGPGPQPTDCDFMTAPLGNKGCHYEMRRVLVDHDGNYIATVNWFNSRTDGKLEDQNAKPETLVITWEKVQE